MKTKTLREQLEERIPTVEAAYSESGYPKVDFSVYPEKLRINRESSYDAIVLVEAARKIERENNPAEIDWGNRNQKKWIPWFFMSPSGFAFGVSSYAYSGAYVGSASRLYVLNEETANFLGEKFPEVWKNVQLGPINQEDFEL